MSSQLTIRKQLVNSLAELTREVPCTEIMSYRSPNDLAAALCGEFGKAVAEKGYAVAGRIAIDQQMDMWRNITTVTMRAYVEKKPQ